MKNADHLLKNVMDAVDTNKDGKIQYEGNTLASELYLRIPY